MNKPLAEKVTKQQALDKAIALIDSFVGIAIDGGVATIPLGTFKDIKIMKQVAGRAE